MAQPSFVTQLVPLIDLNPGTELMYHTHFKWLCVKKRIVPDQKPVYEYLRQNPHENTTMIYDIVPEGEHFSVYEQYISGTTLSQELAGIGRLPESVVLDYTYQLCSILAQIHRAGIVHRDINPNNIIISSDGVLKLIDFGISRIVSPEKSKDTRILGTEGYAAPEQFGFRQSDNRTDIYALGVLIHVMLTGKKPNTSFAPPDWKPVIERCMQIHPGQRYQSVEQLMLALPVQRQRPVPSHNQLPGFRTGATWKMVIAVLFYVFAGITFMGIFIDENPLSVIKMLFAGFIVPFFVIGNPGYIWAKIPPFNDSRHSVILLLRSFLCILFAMIYLYI